MNQVIQVITFCADPVLKTYGSESKAVTSFNAAVNKRFVKDGEPTADFFKYSAFGKTAEFICKYFKKGSHALVVGEIHNNNYEKDGVMHYTNQILINNIEFYGKKTDTSTATTSNTTSTNNNSGTAFGEIGDPNIEGDYPWEDSPNNAAASYAAYADF